MRPFGRLAFDRRVQDLMSLIGVPYFWGRGKPATPWPPTDGLDCSGAAQVILVHLGMLLVDQPDRNALGLANACDPVLATDPVHLGDLAFYGVHGAVTHVMVCLDDEWCLGATGGDSSTFGQDPTAYVTLKRIHYRRDFIVIGRIKAAFRPKSGPDDWTP
jgi:cell wall-associated NlpC family hydrolase